MTDRRLAPEALLRLFHERERLDDRAGEEAAVTWDGPCRRTVPVDPTAGWAMVECPLGLPPGEEGLWIDRQAAWARDLGRLVEWKTYGYDRPDDLLDRLAAVGFTPGEQEVLMLGYLEDLVHDVALPDGLALRAITDEADFARVNALMQRVHGDGHDAYAAYYLADVRADPNRLDCVVVEDAADVLCFAAVRYGRGDSPFAGLWGGATDPRWRRRGLYRATVAHRARLALERGCTHARVDTSPDSRPILTALGLHQVATTTPCEMTPNAV